MQFVHLIKSSERIRGQEAAEQKKKGTTLNVGGGNCTGLLKICSYVFLSVNVSVFSACVYVERIFAAIVSTVRVFRFREDNAVSLGK